MRQRRFPTSPYILNRRPAARRKSAAASPGKAATRRAAKAYSEPRRTSVRQYIWDILHRAPGSPCEVWEVATSEGSTQMCKSYASEMTMMHNEGLLVGTGVMGKGESQILHSERLTIAEAYIGQLLPGRPKVSPKAFA